ncbi:hypothetical protein N9174_02700 [bacterium]|nr:hypothetical protein [bacterium]
MFSYWLQKHDYESEETENVSLNQAISAFNDFDWDGELNANTDKPENGGDCPPGIGYHNGFGSKSDGMLLHICPIDSETIFFNFHYSVSKRFLGLVPYRADKIHYVARYRRNKVDELIRYLFSGNIESILNIT